MLDYVDQSRKRRPIYCKLGKLLRYRREDVESWLKTAMVEVVPRGVV